MFIYLILETIFLCYEKHTPIANVTCNKKEKHRRKNFRTHFELLLTRSVNTCKYILTKKQNNKKMKINRQFWVAVERLINHMPPHVQLFQSEIVKSLQFAPRKLWISCWTRKSAKRAFVANAIRRKHSQSWDANAFGIRDIKSLNLS